MDNPGSLASGPRAPGSTNPGSATSGSTTERRVGRRLLGRTRRASGEDADLLRRIRDGQDAAFGELFAQHADAVRRFALGLAADRAEAEDLTAETFFRVLQAVRRGSGPSEHIRGYLLTVARRVAWEWWLQRRDVPVTDDELTRRVGVGGDTHGRSAEHNLITRAFTSLPERWRSVLWQVEVEGERPAVVASKFGLSANATAALARRARRALRAAYLQAHLAVHRSSHDCRSTLEKLGAYTAGTLSGTDSKRVEAHLDGCPECRSTHRELRDVCFSLRAHAGALLAPAAGGAFAVHQLSASGAASAGAGAAGAGSGSAGFGAAVKGVLFGTRLKIGVAVASSAAAGVFGVAISPLADDSDSSRAMPFPGAPSEQLRVEETSEAPSGPPPTNTVRDASKPPNWVEPPAQRPTSAERDRAERGARQRTERNDPLGDTVGSWRGDLPSQLPGTPSVPDVSKQPTSLLPDWPKPSVPDSPVPDSPQPDWPQPDWPQPDSPVPDSPLPTSDPPVQQPPPPPPDSSEQSCVTWIPESGEPPWVPGDGVNDEEWVVCSRG